MAASEKGKANTTAPKRDYGLIETVEAKDRRRLTRWSWRDRLRCLSYGRAPEPLPSHIGTIEPPDDGKVGICCSGGGVRSAAYNLGALQSLQRAGILRRADYLAAVSGGSYIAAAFAMVRMTKNGDDSDPDLVTRDKPPFYRGSPEEQYLRNRSSYLAQGGMGKLFLAHRVLLGLLFNLFFISLFFVALGMLLTFVLYAPYYDGLTNERSLVDLSIPPAAWITPVGVFGLSVLFGLCALLKSFKRDWARGFFETWAARLLLGAAGIAVFTVLVPALVEQVRSAKATPDSVSKLGATGVGSLVSIVAGVLLQLRARVADPPSVLQTMRRTERWVRRLGRGARLTIAYFAGAVAGPLLLLAALVAAVSVVLANSAGGDRKPAAIALAVSGGFFLIPYLRADLTSWSLHPFYKRRLCSAFALKRVKETNRPNDTTGRAVERNYSDLVPLSETKLDDWPTLLVCAAANISNNAATAPGRGVTSFTFSAEALGGPLVGGVSTSEFEGYFREKRLRNYTLPAAVAMSGAALSPSMGKMTRRPLRFLMALANVRLGVWVPNPQRLDSWQRRHRLLGAVHWLTRGRFASDYRKLLIPLPRPSYLFRELIGLNSVSAKYLYVTDGGHYENLGLVELLRRGCTDVYCFDATGGGSFADLGDAIALARTELNVDVKIDPRPLVVKGERNLADSDCVTGTIKFPEGPAGTLVYTRTVMTAAAPWDVHSYHDADRTFPHHPTADQLYTDQKFEAYRALGELAGRNAQEKMHPSKSDRKNPPRQRGTSLTPRPEHGTGALR